jgi:polyisoprenoid-binding protein YceI
MATANTPDGVAWLSEAAGTWALDPSATKIELRTKAMWVLPVKVTFRAAGGGGTVSEDGGVNGSLSIDASSVDTGNKKRDDHLRSADFFETENHAQFVYTATGVSPAGPDQIKVNGTLTVRGQTRPLDVLATVSQSSSNSATLNAEFELDRSQWGVTWSKMGARLINQVKVSARFTKA